MEPVLNNIRKMIEDDNFVKFMGIKLLKLEKGYSKVSMSITNDMVNLHNVAHGGAIFTLADVAFAAAGNSHGHKAVAMSMNINYRSPVKEGMNLIAEASEESIGRKTALYRMIVKTEDGKLIASSQGTVFIMNEN
jgi:acyl-CoA thioesterase